jgi:hypothetical protein
MKRAEFKTKVNEILQLEVEGLTWQGKVSLVRQCITDADQKMESDESNRYKPWTDDELRLILSTEPTYEKSLRLARAFKRGVGGIQQIYQWASTPQSVIKEKRPDDAFIKQIKRVAKEIGWVP